MTTAESIQVNINYCKKQLDRALKTICTDEIDQMHINSTIEYYGQQIKDLSLHLQEELSN